MRAVGPLFLLFTLTLCGCGANTDPETSDINARESQDSNFCGFETSGELVNSAATELPSTPVEILGFSQDHLLIKRLHENTNSPILASLSGIQFKSLSSGQKHLLHKILSDNSNNLAVIEDIKTCPGSETGSPESIIVQLKGRNGRNLSELLIQAGLAIPATQVCGHALLSACLSTITPNEIVSEQVISKVFWDPNSSSEGKLEILTDAFNVQIHIKGDVSSRSRINQGQSRGYNSTSNFNYPGCAYGQGKVYFFDEYDRPILLADGSKFMRINNSCEKRSYKF